MAWTTPRTWAAGELVTAALLNTQVRDNFDFIAATPHELWLRRSTTQTINDVTRTAISWNAEDRDVGFGFTPTASTATIAQTGVYTMTLCVYFSGVASSFVGIDIDVTGLGGGERSGTSSEGWLHDYGAYKNCAVTMGLRQFETITANAFHNSGASQTIGSGGPFPTTLSIVQVARRLVGA